MVNGAKPSQFRDVWYSEARIASVTDTVAGKAVNDHVITQGTPVIEVVLAFLYRGRFADYLVNLPNDAAAGVLQSKEWFEWDDESVPPQPITVLFSCVRSRVTYKDTTSYRNGSVSGDISIRDQFKCPSRSDLWTSSRMTVRATLSLRTFDVTEFLATSILSTSNLISPTTHPSLAQLHAVCG
jgi:hypothetical protein